MENKLEQGIEYEKYIAEFLKPKYKNAWLWNNVPVNIMQNYGFVNKNGNNCDDIGCDIICETNDGSHHFIQCKNYSTTGNDNTINISDLSGFYNFVAENDFCSFSYVYYSGKLSSQVIKRSKKIKYVNIPYVSFKNFEQNKCVPRDYQIYAYNVLKDKNKGVLDMPCGTGKTLVEFLLSGDYDNTIILSPLISTTEQTITHFKNYYFGTDSHNFIEINSAAGRDIAKYKFKTKNVISSTYDSVDIINKIINTKKLQNVFVIIDEFHNLSQNDLFDNKSEIKKLLEGNVRVLFVSATPKYYENYDYGEKYKLSWDDAINKKYICDFNFTFSDDKEIEKEVSLLKLNTEFVTKIILINKVYFLLKHIEKLKSKKCVVFLRTVD